MDSTFPSASIGYVACMEHGTSIQYVDEAEMAGQVVVATKGLGIPSASFGYVASPEHGTSIQYVDGAAVTGHVVVETNHQCWV